MLVMGLTDLYTSAIAFIQDVDFTTTTSDPVDLFETTIRYVGGMLCAYDLNHRQDDVLLQQSIKLADKLMFAWQGVRLLRTPMQTLGDS